MRRILALFLTAALLLSLVGCGRRRRNSEDVLLINPEEYAGESPAGQEPVLQDPGKVSKDVIYDEHGVKITLKDFYRDANRVSGGMNTYLEFDVVNNSGNRVDVLLGANNEYGFAVNNFMYAPGTDHEALDDGEQRVYAVGFWDVYVAADGITEIVDVAVPFYVRDYDSAYEDRGLAHITPKSRSEIDMNCYQKSIKQRQQDLKFQENVYSGDPIDVTFAGIYQKQEQFEEEKKWILCFELFNHSEEPQDLKLDSLSLDGIVILPDQFSGMMVNAGCKATVEVDLSKPFRSGILSANSSGSCSSMGFTIARQVGKNDYENQQVTIPLGGQEAFTLKTEELYTGEPADVAFVAAVASSDNVHAYVTITNNTDQVLVPESGTAMVAGQEVRLGNYMNFIRPGSTAVMPLVFDIDGSVITGPESIEHFDAELHFMVPRGYAVSSGFSGIEQTSQISR